MAKVIDIIISVHNGYDDIICCFESIFRHTDLSKCRIFIINDASSDERIMPLLQSYECKGTILIDKSGNDGFSAAVNLGLMQSSENDVILLHSDTIVTAGWVEKLSTCACSAQEIGTVTPLSNAAILCSYPVFCKNNPIPQGETIDSLAEIVEKFSFRHYPQIPVGIGFCMYIKRSVINETGLFDSETFDGDHCVVNDFCYRAVEKGYINVMCDDTFIYHQGTEFLPKEEKTEHIQLYTEILEQRYPEQVKNNYLYCSQNTDQYIRDNITLHRILTNGRKNILYVMHLDFQEDAENHIGGTQYHVKDLVTGLSKTQNSIVVARDGTTLRVTMYSDDMRLGFRFDIGAPCSVERFYNRNLAELFRKILIGFSVDVVHIHHVLFLSLDIYTEARRLAIPVITTLHDYFFICPMIKLWDASCKYCGKKGKDSSYCNNCLSKLNVCAEGVQFIQKWREEHLKAIELSSEILAPSISAKAIFEDYFPSLKGKIAVYPHGESLSYNKEEFPNGMPEKIINNNRKSATRLNVACVGTVIPEKGADVMEQLILKNQHISWHFFGDYAYFDSKGSNLKRLPNFISTGVYSREELPLLLNKHQIDVVCILSVCPETFSYTLSEVALASIPVIGINLGAVGERILENKMGWVVTEDRAVEEITDLLGELETFPEKLNQMKQQILEVPQKSCSSMVDDYRKLYDKFPKRVGDSNIEQTEFLLQPKNDTLTDYQLCQSLNTKQVGDNNIEQTEFLLQPQNDAVPDYQLCQSLNTKQIGESIGLKNALKVLVFAFNCYCRKVTMYFSLLLHNAHRR